MKIWLIILGMTLVTYLLRLLPFTLLNEETFPGWVRRSLTYVPITMLSAIVGVSFLPSTDWWHYSPDARLLAGIVAIGVSWLTHNVIITIVAGMAVLLFFQ